MTDQSTFGLTECQLPIVDLHDVIIIYVNFSSSVSSSNHVAVPLIDHIY